MLHQKSFHSGHQYVSYCFKLLLSRSRFKVSVPSWVIKTVRQFLLKSLGKYNNQTYVFLGQIDNVLCMVVEKDFMTVSGNVGN